MKEKIKIQKGFIQIPILIGIIISLVVVGGIGAGLILHKQGKLASLTASISELFKGTGEVEKSQTESWSAKEKPATEEPVKEGLIKEPAAEEEGILETEAREKFNLKKPEGNVEAIAPLEEIDPCAGINCAVCRDCVNGSCIARSDGYNDCGDGCQRCINGSCQDYNVVCPNCQYCSSDSCVNYCQETDTSCGCISCASCNASDRCSGDSYLEYYCSGTSCVFNTDDCSDCSCSCGGYSIEESIANENCSDGRDNDCDGQTDECGGQVESYEYHDYYPIILSLSDNYGTIIKTSGYNGYRGPSLGPWPTRSLEIGDEVRIKVEASDPKNRPILYLWDSTNEHFRQEFNGTKRGQAGNWTSNNEINYTITQETLENSGELFRIVVSIKSEKEYFRNASTANNSWDDQIFIDYRLVIPLEQ